ncbi:uncharacterized protein SOCEGT47_041540 [Sorangium cellulosum]|uniref:Uncharacterized protein n=1 Tax=Sorangium cellulosum TaxID=56 RepID=A0A4P2Q3P0_SORCE|nr:uncharacterized protein SOCEGT47_041540 [Sorangium cellulosum]
MGIERISEPPLDTLPLIWTRRYGPVAWVTVQTGSLGSTRTDREPG